MSKQERLQQNIIKLSNSDNWADSKQEWKLDNIYFEEGSTCLCTHFPITQCCIIHNTLNKKNVVVGNCCVKRFMDINSNIIFDCVKRIKEDNTKSLNKETLEFAKEKGWINDWEYGFYSDTLRKRKLSPKQQVVRIKINNKILQKTKQ